MKRILIVILALGMFAGCKDQDAQTKVAELESKMAESQKKMTSMDSELKKASFEIAQLKNLMTKMGEVVVNLQKASEERGKRSGGHDAAKAGAAKKKAPVPAKKKHH